MKKTIATLAACAMLPWTAQAAVLKYEFTATMREMMHPMPWVYYDVTDGPTAGSTVALGDKITGFFQFDTSTPRQDRGYHSEEKYYYGANNANHVSVTMANGQTFSTWKPAELSTRFNSQYVFWVGGMDTDAVIWDVADASVGVVFVDNNTVRTWEELPASLSLSAFDISDVRMVWVRDSDNTLIWSRARIDTLTPVSSVPEPATYAMLGASLLVGFAAAKRRRRA
ncbi:PEP-CTERM sorting domain-containing protein [Massilia sp. YMA4]|uniref:PEP-CTERM sorting domain-containing protein n=1 Tax=Massilia sp. YMA4 TaxID=1593482 RepID=UPI001878A7BA|nr:PEP-CTERM sorting domain-containing protein [Massilia sp. YMA4]